MGNNHIVIMAGGIGSRFWPMSTPQYPKQFIDVMGLGRSLIQMTVDRFSPLAPMSNFWVVTSRNYVDIVKEQTCRIFLLRIFLLSRNHAIRHRALLMHAGK